VKLEEAFADAIVKNDVERLGQITADDWIVIDPNGETVDRMRFFEVIRWGALTHDRTESQDFRVRVYGNSTVQRAPRGNLWETNSAHRNERRTSL
jgi:ketosteroid isomerase-like protein